MARGCSFHVVDAFKTCQRNGLHSESSTAMMSRNAVDGNLWIFFGNLWNLQLQLAEMKTHQNFIITTISQIGGT